MLIDCCRHLGIHSGEEEDRDPSTVYGGGGGKQPLYFDTCRLRDNTTYAASMLSNCRTDSGSMTTDSYAHMWDLRRHQRQQLLHMHSEDGSTSKHLLHIESSREDATCPATTALAMSRLNRAPVEADDPFYCSAGSVRVESAGSRDEAAGDFASSPGIALRHFYDSPDIALPDRDIRLTSPYADGPVYNEVSSVAE